MSNISTGNPIVDLGLFALEEAVKEAPELIPAIQKLFQKTEPTAQDWADLRASVGAKTYLQYVPATDLTPADLGPDDAGAPVPVPLLAPSAPAAPPAASAPTAGQAPADFAPIPAANPAAQSKAAAALETAPAIIQKPLGSL